MSTATAPGTPNPGLIFDTINAYQKSAALASAIELDLFTAVAAGHRTAEDIANATGASLRGVRVLCDYLAINGFLIKSDRQYALAPETGMFLDRNSPAYFGGAVQFMLDPRLTEPYRNLTEVVRSGRTTMPDEGTVSPEHPLWVVFARQMAPMIHPTAHELADKLDGRGPMRVLDLAAGHGLFGIAIAARNPEATVTALDWGGVLEVANENAARFGVSDRHSRIAGDAFTTDFGGPYDLVLVTNFFHHFDQAACEQLMRKVLSCLAPGGRCITLDFVPNEDRISPAIAASFALMMLGTTVAGDAYTFGEYENMFKNAGFSRSEFVALQRAPQSLVISYRD
ncbi:MAG TPA: class I SAM-dependent methyltransferase [Bryobacteraceae bacterium]|nr:class I SAM-dependent methyltransferase [Bryobacteraceae bacterium]